MNDEIDSNLIGPAEASLFRSNNQIREDVSELIDENVLVQPKNVEVSVDQGVVLLKGRVGSREAKEAAEEAARDVLGVIAVRNELETAA